jgi:2'-5' RNA ligase
MFHRGLASPGHDDCFLPWTPFMIEHRAYIVAEIPEPVRSQVQALRDSLNTLTAKLPVEITLAGSSGVGPIPVGTDLSLIKRHLDRTLADIVPFRARFSAIRAFPNTSIFFLEPFDRSPFDHLHQELRSSGIPFSGIRWPYNPHCTLRGGEPPTPMMPLACAAPDHPP